MSEDSAESLLNQSATSEPAPSGDYQVMSDAYAEPPKKEKTFEGDDATAARAAAADLDKGRREAGAREDNNLTERQYINYQTGERMPSNQTVELGRAATDLERQRGIEKQAVENIDQELLKFSVDAVRQGHDPQQLLAQHVQQQQEQQQQQQTQPAEIQPQPVSELPPEVAELAAELERSPRLKAALQEEAVRIQQAQQGAAAAQQQYLQAWQQATAFAVQSMLAAFPEFQGLSFEQLPAALQVLKASNPHRHADAVQHLARVDQLGRALQQAKAQEQAQTQAVTQQWIQQQDREVDQYLAKNESVETVRAVKDNLLKVVESYGIPEQEFRQAISQVPLLRSAPFQKMLFQLAKTHVLREQVAEKVAKPAVPVVQRPGTSQRGSYAESEVAAAREAFLRSPDDPRLAKRAANS